MKTLLARLTAPLFAAALAHAAPATPVTPVPSVDLNRYLGSWYEIAHLPMFFQRHCLADTTATYSLLGDSRIGVLNRCRTAKGVDQAKGKARVMKDSGNARLKVTFFWPFSGDYWVIGLDPDYRWAVVGEPRRKYLWILSRTPVLPPGQLEAARQAALAQGYDLSGLITTPQNP